MNMEAAISIPNRFESLQEMFGSEIRPLIVPIEHDLRSFIALRELSRVQNGGLLCFLLGTTGIGKTTSVYSASANMPEKFHSVISIPSDIEIRTVLTWINGNTPPLQSTKSIILLFDGREITDDEVGIKQFLSSLNQFLRRRPDVLFCWPTTDAEWHGHLKDLAIKIGGANFSPSEADIEIQGPPASEWPMVLERLLLQFGKTYDDIGVAKDLVGQLCAESNTSGEFLSKVGKIIADRVTNTIKLKKLPKIVFIVSSSGDVVGEANRIRRAGNQILAPEPLLGHSPRSEAGRYWEARNRNPLHHLGYMISLFQASLVTMSASAVVHAAVHNGEADLQRICDTCAVRPDKGNARRIIEASEIFRYLINESIPEFTSGKKGQIAKTTSDAYAGIQSISAKRHKAINKSLCLLIRDHLEGFEFEDSGLEVSHGGILQTDAIVGYGDKKFSLEFHHLSEAQCKAANMASYIMDKLRLYSQYHGLIPI